MTNEVRNFLKGERSIEKFQLVSSFKPTGDQPGAIQSLSRGLFSGEKYQTLLGVTGSGKTFTIANVIAKVQKPTLVISHNKTLAAQLYAEFKQFFPENAVEYFVSYYDYYQPEAYIPQTDTYIEKDASINDEIDRLRLKATSSLLSRGDVLIVASVSCIYGLGSPEDYQEMVVDLARGKEVSRDDLLKGLINIQYERNDVDFSRGRFRVRGDVVEIFPAYGQEVFRIEFFGDKIESINLVNPLTGELLASQEKAVIYPARHFVMERDKVARAIKTIKEELKERLAELKTQNKILEAQRLESRTNYDMEMLKEVGYCQGIENYSRHLSGRAPGSRPYTLLDYFPRDFLIIIDESHVTVPQVAGMYRGDKARKEVLVEHGFRLPSCLDNRPLKLEEFESLVNQVIYASATPAEYELVKSESKVEQLIRPTGLMDPGIIVKPTEGQIDDLIEQIDKRAKKGERTLVTTLTKRMAEDLANYLEETGLKVRYLHSEIETIERVKILKELRLKEFDCLVGINLLREGLDLPEVSLVAILDADKEGFLRSEVSLIQVAGRAARHINGQVIMYADRVTNSMKKALKETERRRRIQAKFNAEHKISPRSIKKEIQESIEILYKAKEFTWSAIGETEEEYETNTLIAELERQMELAARNLEFEKAIKLRDRIKTLRGKKEEQ